MPAVIEQHNPVAWTGGMIDPDGERELSVQEALREAGLDWTVTKVPLFCDMPGDNGGQIEVPDRFGVQRTDTGEVFGTVGKTWQPTQNLDGFKLIEDVLNMASDRGRAFIETAMPIQGGKKVIVMVRIDADMQIAGERYLNYLSFVNGHDGRQSVTAATHDVRYVCANGQIGFLGNWMGGTKDEFANIVRVRHTKNATARIKEAATILGMRNRQMEELAKQGEWLVEQPISDVEFDKFLESLMPVAEETNERGNDTPAATMIKERRDAVAQLYHTSPTNKPLKGTRWGALQSVIEYADHGRKFANDETQIKAQLGITPTPIKQHAFMILKDKKLKPVAA